ncbi:DoxX family protein [Devosia rhodophyticola]|uniref:DoxX family protein n=1 Tax=Devosia rhodophyticola TaxID=3026423 RepID=A0ABY7YTE2_9HYPH|nr:DoxX family protein [Devosia rhodophyticola]WDR04574.1 DoxX family protein [Devosia rhodophyticola]
MSNLLRATLKSYLSADRLIASFPHSVALLGLRIALAIPFWRSGMTKWDGFLNLSSGTRYLFQEEFKLHILGQTFAYPAPLITAFLAGVGEVVLPVLLILGLFTRFAGLGILAMTIIIQLTIPDGWLSFHLPWAVKALSLMAFGGGKLSLDAVIIRLGMASPDRAATARASS